MEQNASCDSLLTLHASFDSRKYNTVHFHHCDFHSPLLCASVLCSSSLQPLHCHSCYPDSWGCGTHLLFISYALVIFLNTVKTCGAAKIIYSLCPVQSCRGPALCRGNVDELFLPFLIDLQMVFFTLTPPTGPRSKMTIWAPDRGLFRRR